MTETLKRRRPRRQFDDDFKAQAVRLVLDEGKSLAATARDLDLIESALRQWVERARHLRGRVLCLEDGSSLTQKVVRGLVMRPSRRAKVKAGVHILRHTFCSHLAMRGAPARAIQELAGHQDLSTTQRYMHLSPAALDAAIRLLDGAGETASPPGLPEWGDIGEAAGKVN